MIATIDFETTGFKAGEDEVLQVSIIDDEYNTLLNVYCKPINKTEWIEAEGINGITPLMVCNELPFERYTETVKDILDRAEKVIAYNSDFENSFLKAYGIQVDKDKWIDPMLMFAEIYGQWDEYHGNYKWQNLSKCARYYGFDFKAHNSLEDVKATLYCYKRMVEDRGAAVPSIPKLEKGAEVNVDTTNKTRMV